MKHLYLLTLLIPFISFSQYHTSFQTGQEQEEWTEYSFGNYAGPYEYEYEAESLVHYYPVGGNEDSITDDWIVSPSFDFTEGAMIDSLNFKAWGFGTPIEGDTIAMYVINANQNPEEANSMVLLKLFTDIDYVNDNQWKTFNSISIPAYFGNSYIAFRYKTAGNWLDIAFDNINIIGGNVDIEEMQISKIKLFPNPATTTINIENESSNMNSKIELFDINGKLVKQYNPNQTQLNVTGLVSGNYILNITSNSQTVSKKVMIK